MLRSASITAPSRNEETSVGAGASDDDKRPSEKQLLNEASQKLEEKKVIMDYVGRFKTVLDVLSKIGNMAKDVSFHSERGKSTRLITSSDSPDHRRCGRCVELADEGKLTHRKYFSSYD